MNDHDRIARVIQYLDRNHIEQPDLGALAERAELSPSHFHRLFSKWAAVTPKDFLQCLTLEHARRLLRRGESVLEAALASGLSGPGRLHDLCINLVAASPGELKTGGSGCEIHYGFAETPFGQWLAARNSRGICHISFIESREPALATLKEEWPNARLIRDDASAVELSQRVFNPRSPSKPKLSAFVRGTPFQLRVWRALLQVPAGALVSYGALAAAIGHPKACRAVGSAVGVNPIAFLIPCHRVIRETGVLGNYRWGPSRKRLMVAWESAIEAGAGIGKVTACGRGERLR